MTLLVIATRDLLPVVFLGEITPANQTTAALAATLMIVGASFFICDGVQSIAAGALRGLNDTRIPLLFSFICFWVIGFSACYGLGFALNYGAFGIWIGLSLSVMLYAAMLVTRFHILTKRGYMPDVPHASH
jgi:MATE family multidrug resistance protein